ncbi:hypothetical protein KKF34_19250 [Myxococcota bacterium]|nr:hypothetical protein [Myxococcota bacterium]MBU1379290.1 hypothetical protein [Myxococcota bacterium]MBU1499026.1 hypothetical protein [Myxococcota bacterium]
MIFTGTVKSIDAPDPSIHNLYISKKGQITIENILFLRKTKKSNYLNQNIFQSDCFSSFKGKVNDKVLVFLYEYEGKYSIAGDKSIIIIPSYEDNLVSVINKYIKTLDPIDIKDEILTLAKYGLGDDFKRILQCRQSRQN